MIDRDMLYIGANYHPHDWDRTRWAHDLDLMKEASFHVVRLGHLCWDSFEPSDGTFCFEWMDEVMDLCAERDIGVFLDIPTRPAPTWLHKKYPSIDIVDSANTRQNAHTRYMEDVGDPHFQKYALRLAGKLAERYGSHKALFAFGLCNELGDGFPSYSETARLRFLIWLEEKYGTIENLNKAWSARRWSRQLSSFDEVDFPIGNGIVGAPERYLDMKRFFSDEIITYMYKLKAVVNENAPGIPVSTNHWAESPRIGFDYNSHCYDLIDFSGQGFYPGINPEDENGMIGACFFLDHRMAELEVPSWNLEFQVGSFGGYASPRKAMRMYAYLSYAYGSQAVCAWTWRSMLGGEEQYLFGLLDHDGETTFKLDEFRQIAKEADTLSKSGLLPRKKDARIAIAYSFESIIVSDHAKDYYTSGHREQMLEAYKSMYHNNLDCNVINLRNVQKKYTLVILPGLCLMDHTMAEQIITMLNQGTTVVMTAFSAKVNEHNQVFDTPLPGLLTEVFGIKVRGFDRAVTHVSEKNEGCLDKESIHIHRSDVQLVMDKRTLDVNVDYHEFLELITASPLAVYNGTSDKNTTVISCNHYGNGLAVYVGVPAKEALISTLMQTLCNDTITVSPLPHGIVSRPIGKDGVLYINTTGKEKTIPASGRSYFSGKNLDGGLILPAYEVEIVFPA